jgi:hypothetical protein
MGFSGLLFMKISIITPESLQLSLSFFFFSGGTGV